MKTFQKYFLLLSAALLSSAVIAEQASEAPLTGSSVTTTSSSSPKVGKISAHMTSGRQTSNGPSVHSLQGDDTKDSLKMSGQSNN